MNLNLDNNSPMIKIGKITYVKLKFKSVQIIR